MAGYYVVKRIDGKPYKYRQRTYREGGKVRTKCQYVCPLAESEVTNTVKVVDDPASIYDHVFGNPFLPKDAPVKVVGTFASENAEVTFARRNISHLALNAEYDRVGRFLEKLDLDKTKLPRFQIKSGKKAGWKRKRDRYEVAFKADGNSSGRNKLKHNYRIALAHALLDRIEEERPILFDYLHTYLDQSYFNTKWLVTSQLLKSSHKNKLGLTLQFLWSGTLPQTLEKQYGTKSINKRNLFKPATWRDEAATMIAEVIKRGYKPALKQINKEKKKAQAHAKRTLTQYRKLNKISRLLPKSRKVWQRYKTHEAAYLISHHRFSKLEKFKILFDGLHDNA